MSLQHISVAVDPELVLKGDVIIIKRTYFDPERAQRLTTICTRCAKPFATQLRRMESIDSQGKRRCEVRNIPQCGPCRRQRKVVSAPAPITDPARLLPENAGVSP